MNKYTIVSIYRNDKGTSCDHCTRFIKNIAVVRDNLTGETIEVGLTCLEKLMNLTVDGVKAIKKESLKLFKLEKEYQEFQERLNLIESNNTTELYSNYRNEMLSEITNNHNLTVTEYDSKGKPTFRRLNKSDILPVDKWIVARTKELKSLIWDYEKYVFQQKRKINKMDKSKSIIKLEL